MAEAAALLSPSRPGPAAAHFSLRGLPRDVKVSLAVVVAVVLGGIAWLFVPYHPGPIVPVLGHVDVAPKPQPPPAQVRPTPMPRPARR
jgi:hypothetical protein